MSSGINGWVLKAVSVFTSISAPIVAQHLRKMLLQVLVMGRVIILQPVSAALTVASVELSTMIVSIESIPGPLCKDSIIS